MINFTVKGASFAPEHIMLCYEKVYPRNLISGGYTTYSFNHSEAIRSIHHVVDRFKKSDTFNLSFYKNPIKMKIYSKEYLINSIRIQARYDHDKQEYDSNLAWVSAFHQGNYITAAANKIFTDEINRQGILKKLLALKPCIVRNEIKANLLAVTQDLNKIAESYKQASEWLEKYQAEIDQELALMV
jgi:hypothetical protein